MTAPSVSTGLSRAVSVRARSLPARLLQLDTENRFESGELSFPFRVLGLIRPSLVRLLQDRETGL